MYVSVIEPSPLSTNLVASPLIDQVPGTPFSTDDLPVMLIPFIAHTATSPLVSCQSISYLPSPL
ncbi:hypothetical protein MBAV_005757 [Candidatus Magnetobacterium bavaricum]|uniref:Uncharacterized protein n=1 Tax=Candidatus Magnetobacterium bavaricum TaxID=29290 RepID=A0A0F3GJA9_9BACT|nr:hypothetical protein MBAV_005757 [Candidatus Magnetobacterium bavaricum]